MLVAVLILFAIGYGVVGLIVLLLALVVLLGLSHRPTPQRQFTLGLIAWPRPDARAGDNRIAGDVGRMNTVFCCIRA